MYSAPPSSKDSAPGLKAGGFTLVEIVMALGIVSFAMVGMIGLLPVGLAAQREAESNMVQSHIVQTLSNDILLTDFKNLTSGTTCYYDNEGKQVAAGDSAIYTATVTLDALGVDSSLQFQGADGASGDVYNAKIAVSYSNRPGQTSKYSVVVAKTTY